MGDIGIDQSHFTTFTSRFRHVDLERNLRMNH